MTIEQYQSIIAKARVLTIKLTNYNSPKDVSILVTQYFMDNNINVEMIPEAMNKFFQYNPERIGDIQ